MASNVTRRLLSFLPLEDRLTPAVRMLPDLLPDPSNLAGWTVSTVGGVTELAYATGMQNVGKGAFELRGTSTIITNGDGSQSQVVTQRVYNDDLTFADQVAGAFTYHPTHGHVHYDDFAWGRIRTRPTANWEDGTVVATGPKTSFCLLDLSHNNPSLPGSPASGVYNTCGSAIQGISVGWKDIYSSGLDGQQIDITGLPNGNYWLEVVADPMNRVEETDETNNTTRIAISLSSQPAVGMRVLTSSPLGASNDAVNHITLNFNMAVDTTTFTAADVTLNGPNGAIPVTSITPNSSTSFNVNFANQTKVGTYTANFGPNIAALADGKLMNQDNDGNYGEATDDIYTNVFTITAPRVQATTPSGSVTGAIASVRVQYNKPLDNSTVTFADIVSFTGPGGGDLMSQVSGIVPVTAGSSALWDINFTSMTGFGTYTLVLEPNMSDTLGNLVDQNGDLTTNAGDRYTATFTIVPLGITGPDTFGYTAQSATYENLSGLTGWTDLTFSSNDDAVTTLSLGTNTFNLYGTSYTGANQLYISTNGLMTFGESTLAYENSDLSGLTYNGTTIYAPAIAPLWDDWIKGSGTPHARSRFQDTNGDSVMDRLIIEWNQIRPYNTTTDGATFQAILQLNTGVTPGDITLNYADINLGNISFDNGANATVGIRGSGATASKLLVNQNSGSNALVNSTKAVKVAVPRIASITRMNPNPAYAGDVEFLVTFTEGVTGVDVGDFTVASTGSVVGAHVEHMHTTADPKVYELHVDSGIGGGTLRLDLLDNDSIVSLSGAKLGGLGTGNGAFAKGEVYTIVQPPPTVQGINIGDGTSQRSMLKQVQVVFNQFVSFSGNPSDAFVLTGPNGTVPVAVDLSASAPNQTTAKLTFSGSGTWGDSLKDGIYTLTVLSSKVGTAGVALDGDGVGGAGGNYTATFKRLFGDVNGDAHVDATDFAALGNSFGSSTSATGYTMAFDFGSDGTIDATDLAEFGARFGITL